MSLRGRMQTFSCACTFKKENQQYYVTEIEVPLLSRVHGRWITDMSDIGSESLGDFNAGKTRTPTKKKTKLHGLSPRANYSDRATAACR
jgi:hypothetical protein